MPKLNLHKNKSMTNGKLTKLTLNDTNGINDTGENFTQDRRRETDDIADYLVSQFSSPQSRKFYCKVAYNLPLDQIQNMVSIAKADAKKNPGGYFNVMARKEMGEIN